jgi:hypothetical protein
MEENTPLRNLPDGDMPRTQRMPLVEEKSERIREIRISQLDFGYVVNVGCQSFAIESAEKLLEKLAEYIKEPAKTEEKWFKTRLL